MLRASTTVVAFVAAFLHAAEASSVLSTFNPGAFVIRRQIGQLGYATEVEWAYRDSETGTPAAPNPLDPNQPKRTVENSGAAVRLFDARLDDGTRVLLKEFIGEACEIGENECATYELLYQRALALAQGSQLPAAPPSEIGRLLGSMRADSSFASDVFVAEWEAALPNIMPPSPNGFWLVFQWENLRTVSNFPDAEQGAAGLFDVAGKQAEQARRRFVKAAAQRCLEVIAWLHGQGIAHRSLGGASLLLNTYDQRTPPKEVAVSVIDLGFATTAARIAPEESLKRLVEDVFDGDVCEGFRGYCVEEPSWAGAVELLDEADGAGWRVVQALVDCRDASSERCQDVSAERLLESPWFAA